MVTASRLSRVFSILTAICLSAAGLGHAAEPLASIRCVERLGIDWPRTMVTYRVSLRRGQLRDTRVHVVDGEDKARLAQLWAVARHADGSVASARASFMAELPAEGSYALRLMPGDAQPTDRQLRTSAAGGLLTLENSAVAIRLLAAGDTAFDEPLRFGNDHAEMLRHYGKQIQAGLAPGPIQGIRLADGKWAGGSYFKSDDPDAAPKVTSVVCGIAEQGPIFVEARVRYELTGGGYYQLAARMIANDPAVRIDEQMNVGGTFPPDESLRVVMSLSDGWRRGFKPDRVFWCAPRGRLGGRDAAFDGLLERQEFDVKSFQEDNFGHRVLKYDQPSAKVFDLLAWYPWNPAAHYFGLADSRRLAADRNCPFVAVVPMHAGSWRSSHMHFRLPQQFPELRSHQDGDVAMHWPLRPQPHPNTLLHTGEYDPEQPLTFMRRLWALVGGPMQYHDTLYALRHEQGFVTLDDYKDWVLGWRADPAVTYPRLVLRRSDVGRLAPRLKTLPGGESLGEYLYFKDDAERREQLWKRLRADSTWNGPWGQTRLGLRQGGDDRRLAWTSHYRQTQMAAWAHEVDELLASPSLEPERREQLRTELAAFCSLMANADFNPRGSMVHLGNPNMPINRFMALPFAASLIPDHPEAGRWLDVSADYLRFKLAMNVAPSGAWSELITYFGASAPHMMQAAKVLEGAERLDEPTARLAALPAKFTANLLAPVDPRFSKRTLPNWGHEGCDLTTHWLVAAGLVRRTDPQLAKSLAWCWDQLGQPKEQHHDAGFSPRLIANADLLDGLPTNYVPDLLNSTWWPGFGATLRAHAGDPDETFLALRQGYLTSHCDANQGDFILHAKGAPLVTLSLFGYAIHNDRPFAKLNQDFGWHSRVRFGSQTDTGGWPGGGAISNVHAHSFGDSVDYLLGLGDYGPQRWSRQILLLKGKKAGGPNYFVFRDSFHNQRGNPTELQPKWWCLRTLGSKDQVRVSANELNYTSRLGTKPRLNVHFLQPASITAESRDASQSGPMYNQAAINWREAGSPTLEDRQRTSIRVEETMTVTPVGPVARGDDVMVVLYPQRSDERPPRYEALADGVARIGTGEGTDYVFARRRPIHFEHADVTFEGTAGAVRVYPDAVHLVIAEGPGTVSYKSVTLVSEVPAVRVIPVNQTSRDQVIRVPTPKSNITFQLATTAGPIEEPTAGVRHQTLPNGEAWQFDAPQTIVFDNGEVQFIGRRGGILVDRESDTVRLVMLDGSEIGHGEKLAEQWISGPFEVTFAAEKITGRSAGIGRFVHLTRPPKLDRLPTLVIDDVTYAPGTVGQTLIVPIMPGEHRFEIHALEQPPVFRSWQRWR